MMVRRRHKVAVAVLAAILIWQAVTWVVWGFAAPSPEPLPVPQAVYLSLIHI